MLIYNTNQIKNKLLSAIKSTITTITYKISTKCVTFFFFCNSKASREH